MTKVPSYPLDDSQWSSCSIVEPEGEKKLWNLDSVLAGLKGSKFKNIIVMAGAGLSVSAGIPDFRSPDTGLFHNLSSYSLPYPEAIFELSYFRKNPAPFFRICKELWPDNQFEPTKGHQFVNQLKIRKSLRRMYTQNIDGLERLAGIEPAYLVEAHGNCFNDFECMKCHKSISVDQAKQHIHEERVIKCSMFGKERNCEGVIKPSVVFYGEKLPDRFYQLSPSDFKRCDLLIIMGTSLTVTPFCNLVELVHDDIPRILINNEPSGKYLLDYSSSRNTRDIFLQGSIDDVVSEIIEKLDWELLEDGSEPHENKLVDKSSAPAQDSALFVSPPGHPEEENDKDITGEKPLDILAHNQYALNLIDSLELLQDVDIDDLNEEELDLLLNQQKLLVEQLEKFDKELDSLVAQIPKIDRPKVSKEVSKEDPK